MELPEPPKWKTLGRFRISFGSISFFGKMGSIDLPSREEGRSFIPLWPLSASVILKGVVWAAANGTDLGEDEICCER